MNMSIGLLGRKIGMTQFFDATGAVVPCTVVEAGPNVILSVKSDETDGYNAVQLGFDDQKPSRVNKPDSGHFAKSDSSPKKFVREIRLDSATAAKFSPGQELRPGDVFAEGDKVDVTGTSKGRGFGGVMKKFNFKGFIRTHGTHEFFRHGGSIGTRLTPGHVAKGTKMPGQFGNSRVTIQSLTVARIDADKNLIYIKGGLPGPNGGYLIVRKAIKG
jgi:large subunit ribosomal protein L3